MFNDWDSETIQGLVDCYNDTILILDEPLKELLNTIIEGYEKHGINLEMALENKYHLDEILEHMKTLQGIQLHYTNESNDIPIDEWRSVRVGSVSRLGWNEESLTIDIKLNDTFAEIGLLSKDTSNLSYKV